MANGRQTWLMSLAAVVLVFALLPRTAAAAETDVRALVEQGLGAYAKGSYADAIEAFDAADQLQPQAALAFNIARSYEQLQDWDDALKHYREYLARAPAAADREQVEQHVRELTARRKPISAAPRVKLIAEPAGASVWVDDEPVGHAPVTLELPRGLHRARFKLPGYRTYYTTFDLTNGTKPLEVRGQLQRGSDLAPPIRPDMAAADGVNSAPDAARSGSPLLRNLGFSAMIASAAALGGAVVFEVMRGDADRNAHNSADPARSSDALERMRTNQMLAQVFAGAGGGLAALGVTLLVLSRADDDKEAHSTRVALTCAPAKCAANLRGVF
jgi:tetratricopeptide (TPR) repeat protein